MPQVWHRREESRVCVIAETENSKKSFKYKEKCVLGRQTGSTEQPFQAGAFLAAEDQEDCGALPEQQTSPLVYEWYVKHQG